MAKRTFGSVRKLPSGRYQASYWHEGERQTASRTFGAKATANAYLATVEADIRRGGWIDPSAGAVVFRDYADRWLTSRHDLAERTVELYRWLLDRHILPTFGSLGLARVSPSAVRSWHAALAKDHATTAAKAYRLLREIMGTAVADSALTRNPCQVKGAGQERAAERQVATLAAVEALASAMPERQRIAVLLAAWCQLRRAEVLGLRRKDVDPLRATLSVVVTRTKTMAGTMVEKAPKTEAGRRTVTVPSNVLPALLDHLDRYVGSDPDALVLDGGNRSLRTAWDNARRAVGVSYSLHDMRHFGLTMAAATGATTKELMRRAGHASPAAALRYQHATEDRDRVLADALAELSTGASVMPIRCRGS